MDFFKKIFSAPSRTDSNFYSFAVKCDKCGEVIGGRINVFNDLSVEYEGSKNVYFGRKVLMGTGLCFQKIEVELKFDEPRRLLEKHITGGKFVES